MNLWSSVRLFAQNDFIILIIYNTRMKALIFVALAYYASAILDRTYYEALELPVSASQEEIRDAFRKLSRKYHPDRNPGAKEKF